MEGSYIIINQQINQVQIAWIWFLAIPLLLFLGWITYNLLKGDNMVILGMPMSGKTTMLRHMQGLPFDPTYIPTQKDLYKEFDWTIGDRTIKAGVDLSGDDAWVKENYPKLIEDNEIIFFVFDAFEFEDDPSYRRGTLARLDFTFEQIKEKKGDVFSFIEHHFALIGTHADKISDSPKYLIRKWQKDYSEKSYNKIFKNNIAVLDMRNVDELNDFLKRIFL